ncbi:MAG: malto-oligosyltrehalose trehalohydrolase [Planctomycetes bacterium]|nr:malto-oligosyltrehalose trehalohydrolase [Planctomycetota bacterium]
MPGARGALTEEIPEYAGRRRRFPVGAEVIDRRIDFRIWAPSHKGVEVVIEQPRPEAIPMTAEEQGYFSAIVRHPGQRVLYRFRLNNKEALLPDPAARFQPEGPHGPSEVIDPTSFAWTDQNWRGPALLGQIIYEMHIGTFTPEGTWLAAARQLPELAANGIGLLEMMPIADFPGQFGWSYDGVDLFAPTRLYGRPDDLRHFIDAAHELGIGVILDVVYNHFGPDGNYLLEFSPTYFTDRYQCEWGNAINFDGPESRPVRGFFIANAGYWIEEFHFDGFRLDATQQIFDASKPGIIAEITERARRSAGERSILVMAENEPQRAELLLPSERGGAGLDALWNDDFHHALMVALTGKKEAYYSDYHGSPQEIVSTARHGFLYQGQWSRWQNHPRGTPSFEVEHAHFVCYLQNHDQVANSTWGHRLGQITSPGKHRAATALLLLGPWTPMLFQGQEFAASTPFLFFADHKPETAAAIAKGRVQFLRQFASLATEGIERYLADPGKEDTFLRSKLDFRERETNWRFVSMFQELVTLRKEDAVFSWQGEGGVDGAVLAQAAFVLRFFGEDTDRLLLVNFGPDLFSAPAPEPLLAPPRLQEWKMIFSTDDPHFGGGGTPEVRLDQGWRLPAEAALVFASEPLEATDDRAGSPDSA